MPPLTRALVRAALVWLVLGFALAFLLALGPIVGGLGAASVLQPAALHALTTGFLAQMIFGVALWLFPRARTPAGRARAAAGWLLLLSLNGGLGLRLVAEPLIALSGTSTWGPVLIASAGLQWIASVTFVALAWPRVRAR